MIARCFLPLILIIIVAFVVCGMYGVNIFGELIILGMIYYGIHIFQDSLNDSMVFAHAGLILSNT